MATNFPTNLDNLANPSASDKLNSPSHSQQHANANDAIEALEAKVGIDDSSDSDSLDYKVRILKEDDNYWNDQCALIDPACVEYYKKTGNHSTSNSPLLTVPSGEWRYLIAAWNIGINQDTDVDIGNNSSEAPIGSAYWAAMQIQPSESKISKVSLNLKKVGSPTGNLNVAIETDDGSNKPSGNTVGTVVSLDASTLTTSFQEIYFSVNANVTPNTKYHVTIKGQSSWDDNNAVKFGYLSGSGFNYYNSGAGSWTNQYTTVQVNIRTFYVNRFDIRILNEPVLLPAGTSVYGIANGSDATIINPFSVIQSNPKSKYYERLNTLKSMTPYSIGVNIPAGSSRGTTASANFPTDFTKGLMVFNTNFDTSWGLIGGSSAGDYPIHPEISDDHQNRTSIQLLFPFRRGSSYMEYISSRAGSVSGDSSETSLAGDMSIMYYKLPSNW